MGEDDRWSFESLPEFFCREARRIIARLPFEAARVAVEIPLFDMKQTRRRFVVTLIIRDEKIAFRAQRHAVGLAKPAGERFEFAVWRNPQHPPAIRRLGAMTGRFQDEIEVAPA